MKNNDSYIGVTVLKRLITKWKEDAEKVEKLTSHIESKHQRQTANHFLIQLYKCIGDAEAELKNCEYEQTKFMKQNDIANPDNF